MHHRRSRAFALTLTIVASLCAPAAAAPPSAVEFDEIDHVYTTGAVPPPGSFRQDAGLATAPPPAAPAQPAARPNRGIFGALGAASTILGGASSVVAASGAIGQSLRIADDFTKLSPLVTAMGMAGSRQFDALLQTYVLPRVSPTGAVMLQGFLAAQTEYRAHFGVQRDPSAPPPEPLAPYARGALRHYIVASNGWVRIDDPNTNLTIVIKPELRTTYLIDTNAQTVRSASYAPAAVPQAAGASGTAAVDDRVEALGPATLDGIAATGYRTTSTLRINDGGACRDATITSSRVEYFAPYRIASDAANTAPASAPSSGGCDPSATARHGGAKIPAGALVVYEANTVETTTPAGTDRYTFVLERGNLQERAAADLSVFDVPAGYRRIS